MAQPTSSADERLRLALDYSGVGDWTWDPATDEVVLSATAAQVFGLAAGEPITWDRLRAEVLHPDDAAKAEQAVLEAIDRRRPYATEYRIVRPSDGAERWLMARGMGRFGEDGACVGMVGIVGDITERKLEQVAAVEEAQALDLLNRTGALVASELDLEKVVQAVTDAGVEITGAQFGAFFYNQVNQDGEAYTLYTLSGAPRSAFERFPMPRNTAVFAPTFTGEGVVRSGDILADSRYGHMEPYRGMPPGHLPVRSYLAVPVTSRSGEVVGGLFFGHADADVFDARDERVMVGVASQAAIAIDNAQLYRRAQREIAERQRAEAAVQALADQLEARVAQRTRELEEANLERERAEEALRHVQKLEAVGHLTGGVAHDFNNLLTVVLGNLDTLKRRIGGGLDVRAARALDSALDGSRRAAALTQRLLAFARRQPLDPKAADPNRLVSGMSDLLHRTLGERIEIETVLGARVWPVEVDVGQLESALLNLAVNARDAMPEGGKLTIETQNIDVDDVYARGQGMQPGQYVAICVTDTGVGMEPALIERVFEPFFTTKPTGHGTGLGLSQVYGFIRQSGGAVRIYSEPGEGSTVKLYLPRFIGEVAADQEAAQAPIPGDCGETVLVVEDEEAVRALSVALFEELGYTVLQTGDPYAALEILDRSENIDLLFTDVGLPKMNGRQLAEEARRRRPGLKVLFTTGYARNAIVHHGRLDPGVDLIGKPFTFADLAEKVRAVLDRPV